jgi:hypothetical protein
MSLPSYGVHGRLSSTAGGGSSKAWAGLTQAGPSASEDPRAAAEDEDLLRRMNGHYFKGQKQDLQPHGQGEYTFSNGTVYTGSFVEGLFDGAGTLTFPDGGRFAATWRAGQLVEGQYFFADALEYQPKNWGYCTDADRRFWSEQLRGLEFGPAPQLTDSGEHDTRSLPLGCYDLGDCYLNPTDNKLYNYDGTYYRHPTPEELTWAKRKARIGLDKPATNTQQ